MSVMVMGTTLLGFIRITAYSKSEWKSEQYELFEVWLIWEKFRYSASKLLSDGDKWLDMLEKICQLELKFY